QTDKLPRAQAAPVLVRAQRERGALRRLVAHGRYLSAHVVLHEQWAHELDIAVDAMWIGERLEQARAQQAAAEATRRGRGRQRYRPASVSAHMFTEYTYTEGSGPIHM